MPRGHYKRGKHQAAQPLAVEVPAEPASADPLEPNRNMETMDEAQLRSYALQIGVNRRDAAELPVSRLKQNCMLVLNDLIEELS